MEKTQAYSRELEEYRNRSLAQAKLALEDDVGAGDITTQAVVAGKLSVENAVIFAKARGVLCGLLEAKAILEEGGLEFRSEKAEGDITRRGEVIARVHGDVKEILKRERTALDYLQVLSGIATGTRRLASRYPGKVASLRKTHPGLCYSEKRAVKVGGGLTHRLGLYDGLLIKDNHLAAIVREIFGAGKVTEEKKIKAIEEALRRAKRYQAEKGLNNCFIEVEVESLGQAVAAARFNREEGVPDMILLDNMEPHEVVRCVKAIRREAGREVLVEASGGITAKNIDAYMKAGVDVVSMSELTLSARPLDISMKIIGYK